jgi:hypothetical protein
LVEKLVNEGLLDKDELEDFLVKKNAKDKGKV